MPRSAMLLDAGKSAISSTTLHSSASASAWPEVIRSSSDASSLLALHAPRSSLVTVSIPGASEEQCRRWETELNDSLAECGCELGGRFTAVAAGLSAAIVLIARTHGTPIRRLTMVAGSVVILAAGTGKYLALAGARNRITRTVGEIRQQELEDRRRANIVDRYLSTVQECA